MGQECRIAIVGAGASGSICAYFLKKAGLEFTIFDYSSPLRTLLPTGGGRCNLAYAEYDFKELAKNYPRGEKFLYSVFSQFSAQDTILLFKEIGVETYTQEDGRIFPKSNSSNDVREKILNSLKGADFRKEKVLEVIPLDTGYKLKTTKAEYFFSDVIIATGGGTKINGLIKHTVKPFHPSLVGLNTEIKTLSGITLQNVYNQNLKLYGDILFTHYGISGPLIYKITSIMAGKKFPYKITLDLKPESFDLQTLLNSNPQKELKNVLGLLLPLRLSELLCGKNANLKAHTVNGKIRDEILFKIHNFELNITGTNIGEETVTAGGYALDEISSKTMESKIYPGIYIVGEVLDIDGFCGGFNLQNAWSTAFVATNSIIEKSN